MEQNKHGRRTISNPRTSAIARTLVGRLNGGESSLLVVGCGSGTEAAVLAEDLKLSVTGIDIAATFDPEAARIACLQRGDATALEFASASFDVVYSYHALEHIADWRTALSEMRRVLRPGGSYCIGTPNRMRLLGYIGGDSKMGEKIAWNLADWRARLAGRFRNEFGAHAGFSASELREMLLGTFSSADDVTVEYYRTLYSGSARVVALLVRTGLAGRLFPSVYFVGGR